MADAIFSRKVATASRRLVLISNSVTIEARPGVEIALSPFSPSMPYRTLSIGLAMSRSASSAEIPSCETEIVKTGGLMSGEDWRGMVR